ncbi:hypothetical protein [Thioalkalivibrio sp. ALJ8]|uniref:head-tail joining protein n=1 Tax=Thioalkalivibrio sp. ALJ8 TaxID=1158757 RepID=UPI00035F6C31|nr:hypothetical protein [Thioalkalivibrio sp. ALJ8]
MIDFGPMHDQLFDAFGQAVTVDGTEVQGVVHHDMEVITDAGMGDRRTMLDLRPADAQGLRAGAPVQVQGDPRTYRLDQQVSHDGHVIRWMLR